MSDNKFIHELQAVTGFGDRILDVWAVLTIAKLLDPSAEILIKWNDGPKREVDNRILGETFEASLERSYSTNHFQIPGCRFVEDLPSERVHVLKSDEQTVLNTLGTASIADGIQQLVLVSGAFPGNSSPDIIHQQRDIYGIDSNVSAEDVTQTFRNVAESTVMSSEIEAAIPADAGERVGIHVRLTDKLVANEVSWEMTPKEWQLIEHLGLAAIRNYISKDIPLMICSDDPRYRKALADWVTDRGGDVVTVQAPENLSMEPGYLAAADFFALSRSRNILQLTKYSTFSIAAALTGNVPFTNFRLKGSKKPNLIETWKGAFCEFRYAEDEIGKWACLKERAFNMIRSSKEATVHGAAS